MKYRGQVAKKFGLIGAGVGLTLFALFGLLEGSLIGGAVGLDIVNSLFHAPAGPTLLSRVIVGASMLAGVIVSGIFFVVSCSTICWAAGYITGLLSEPKAESAVHEEARPGTVK
jgi:hypothetical protein